MCGCDLFSCTDCEMFYASLETLPSNTVFPLKFRCVVINYCTGGSDKWKETCQKYIASDGGTYLNMDAFPDLIEEHKKHECVIL